MVGAVNKLMNKVSKDVMMELPKKATKLQDTIPGQLSKVTDKIPSPDIIKERICGTNNMNTSKKMYNQMGDQMNKAQKLIDKVKRLIDKLNAIISKVKALLNAILDIAKIISSLLDALKFAIPALEAVLVSQTVPHINGKVLDVAINKKKDIKDKIKMFSNVAAGIAGKVEFIIPKLNKIEGIASSLNSLPNLPQDRLNQSKDTMDQCMKDRLVEASPPADSLEDGVDGGVDAQNQTLDSLIDKENKNQRDTTKIEEFGYKGFPKTEEYTVRTVPSDEL
jgi:DNA repair exonuclease SbcCD ATPase subunit